MSRDTARQDLLQTMNPAMNSNIPRPVSNWACSEIVPFAALNLQQRQTFLIRQGLITTPRHASSGRAGRSWPRRTICSCALLSRQALGVDIHSGCVSWRRWRKDGRGIIEAVLGEFSGKHSPRLLPSAAMNNDLYICRPNAARYSLPKAPLPGPRSSAGPPTACTARS
jgi:hypothetical protein